MTITPQFQLGQKVKAISFVNCFGKTVAEVPGLTVTRLTFVSDSVSPYYRIEATNIEHYDTAEVRLVEAAERFFAAE